MSDDLYQCAQCQRPLAKEDLVASMSGSILGDECSECYYLCPVCQVYTKVTWWETFCGPETGSRSDPIPKEEGDRRVGLIRQCSEPWDKKCRCAAHRAYFGDSLD